MREHASNYVLDVLVVDNHSTDDSDEVLDEFAVRGVCTIRLAENLGGAGGVRCFHEYAMQRDYEFVWMLDNDALPSRKFLDRVLQYLGDHPDVGVAGGQVLSRNDLGRIVECGAVVTEAGELRPFLLDKERRPRGEVYDCDYVAFLSTVVRMTCLRAIGPMDDAYFLHWDDCDFGVRAKRAGWKVVALTSAIVMHPPFSGRTPPPPVRYYDERNHLLFLRKNAPNKLSQVVKRKWGYWRYQAMFGDAADAVVTQVAIVDGLRGRGGPSPTLYDRATAPEVIAVVPGWSDIELTDMLRDIPLHFPSAAAIVLRDADGPLSIPERWEEVAQKYGDRVAAIVPRGPLTIWHVLPKRVLVYWNGSFIEIPPELRRPALYGLRTLSEGPGFLRRLCRYAIRETYGRLLKHAIQRASALHPTVAADNARLTGGI